MSPLILSLVLIIFAAQTLGADKANADTVYQYVDKNGTVVFTDKPEQIPPDKLKETRLREMRESKEKPAPTKPATAAKTAPAESSQAKAKQLPKITLFMTSWCGYCRKLKSDLDTSNIAYVEKDIEKDAAAGAEFRERFHGGGVPVLVIGDEVIRGYNPQRTAQVLSKYQ